MHVRDRVVDSACLNRCLLEFTARKLCRFVLKNLRMYDFKQNILLNNTFGTYLHLLHKIIFTVLITQDLRHPCERFTMLAVLHKSVSIS